MRFAKTGAISFAAACFVLVLILAGLTVSAANPGVAPGDTTKVEKERVLKETARPVTHEKETRVAPETDDEGSFFSSCLGGCIGELIGSMLGSICSGASSEGGTEHVVVHDAGLPQSGSMPVAMEEGESDAYYGTVASANMGEDSVEVWNRPGGGEAGGWVLCVVANGTDVAATQFKFFEEELWVRIQAEGAEPVDGWVHEKEIVIQKEMGDVAQDSMEIDRPIELSSARDADLDRPRWHLRANIFYPEFTCEAIDEEYSGSAGGGGIEAGLFLTRSINIGLLFNYAHANGTPLYKYVGETLTDWPIASDLNVLHFGAQFGQLLRINTWYFDYGVGPAVFLAKESASIDVYDGLIRQGMRTDELSKWKFGASAGIGTGWLAGGRVPLGVSIRVSWMPWEAEREKSLTLDYLEDDSIYIVNLGLSVGFLSF